MRKIEKINRFQEGFFLFMRTFTDITEFIETVVGWEFELHQLDKGKFSCELFQAGNNFVLLTYIKCNRQIAMKGNAPKGMRSFGIPFLSKSPIIWRDHKIVEKRVQTYKPNAELNGITPPGFETFVISISERLFDEMVRTIGDDDSIYLNVENESLMCNEKKIDGMHNFLDMFRDTFNDEQFELKNDQLLRIIELEIPERLIDLISSGVRIKPKPSSIKKNLAIEKFIEYLNKFPDDRLTVLDFCSKSNVSKRTLEIAMQDRFNISPKKYINTMRLNSVRRELNNSDSSSIRIVNIANRYGFWHMGQFAKDYNLMFGELPSVTLAGKR